MMAVSYAGEKKRCRHREVADDDVRHTSQCDVRKTDSAAKSKHYALSDEALYRPCKSRLCFSSTSRSPPPPTTPLTQLTYLSVCFNSGHRRLDWGQCSDQLVWMEITGNCVVLMQISDVNSPKAGYPVSWQLA